MLMNSARTDAPVTRILLSNDEFFCYIHRSPAGLGGVTAQERCDEVMKDEVFRFC